MLVMQFKRKKSNVDRIIVTIVQIIHQMDGTKRYGPCAKGTALRITVLGNGRGMLGWLVVGKKKGKAKAIHSIEDGSQERKKQYVRQ